VTTKKGTDITFDIRGRNAYSNDGNYTKKGSGGNLPAGEVYIAPKKGKVYGTVIIDGTIKHRWGTSFVNQPIRISVERGEVQDIKGGMEANLLHKTLEWAYSKSKFPWGIKCIGELGIGINPRSTLIGATIMDEKVLGTAHIAFGSNYWFGGNIYSIIHLDQVFKDPKIYVDGDLLKI
ncbi:MAG: aminopeptidase, partial [Nanoarchaeota archaeon]